MTISTERLQEMLAACEDYIANHVADFDDDPHADSVGEFNPYTIRDIITELVELRKAAKPFADGIQRYQAHWHSETGGQSPEDDSETVEFMGWLGSYFPLVTLGDFRRIAALSSPTLNSEDK